VKRNKPGNGRINRPGDAGSRKNAGHQVGHSPNNECSRGAAPGALRSVQITGEYSGLRYGAA
jgi:hypothetical protein